MDAVNNTVAKAIEGVQEENTTPVVTMEVPVTETEVSNPNSGSGEPIPETESENKDVGVAVMNTNEIITGKHSDSSYLDALLDISDVDLVGGKEVTSVEKLGVPGGDIVDSAGVVVCEGSGKNLTEDAESVKVPEGDRAVEPALDAVGLKENPAEEVSAKDMTLVIYQGDSGKEQVPEGSIRDRDMMEAMAMLDDLSRWTEKVHSGDTEKVESSVKVMVHTPQPSASSSEVRIVSSKPPTKGKSTKKSAASKRRVQPSRTCLVGTKRTLKELEEGDEPAGTSTKKLKVPKKEVLEELVCTRQWFEDQQLNEILDLLKVQGWDNLFETEELVSPSMVLEFYSKVSKEVKGKMVYLDFVVGGQELRISSHELSKILDIPHKGYDQFVKGVWPEGEEDRYTVQERICGTSEPGKVPNKYMTVKVKILHKLFVTNFLQRGSKTSYVQLEDILILDKLLKGEEINLPKLILHQMEYLSTQKTVGYARFIKKILELHEVYGNPDDEVPIVKRFDVSVFKKMGLVFDEVEGWVRDPLKLDFVEEDQAEDQVPQKDEETSIDKRLQSVEKGIEDLKAGMRTLTSDVGDLKKSVNLMVTEIGRVVNLVSGSGSRT